MTRHSLFSQKCWSFTLPRHEEYKRLINQILLLDKTDPNFRLNEKGRSLKSQTQTNVYAWRSDWHLHDFFPVFKELCREVTPFLHDIIKEEKIKDTSVIETVNCWINKYKKGDFAQPHLHDVDLWSVIYFMNSPQDSQAVFRVHNPLGITYNSGLLENFRTLDINTEEGSVLIMSGAMRHEVTPNKSEEERITVAMNFRMFDLFAGSPTREEISNDNIL